MDEPPKAKRAGELLARYGAALIAVGRLFYDLLVQSGDLR